MKKFLILFIIFSLNLFANSINIAIASNVSYAINELIKEFNKTNPNTKVQITLGSSGKLTAQIINGAPYNLFMSADMKYPEKLYRNSLTIYEPKIYAKGGLSIISSKDINLAKDLRFLTDKNIDKIAIANPKTAPYGKATIEALKNANIYNDIKNKFVYAESISQTVTYALKASDLGFIAKSSLYSEKMKKYKNYIDVDTKLYTPINQGIVLLNKKKNSSEAKAFYEFILSDKAQTIFKQYGYLKP